MNKNKKFFLSSPKQQSKFNKVIKKFGKDKVAFLDRIVGGKSQPDQYSGYQESVYMRN